jgi:endonuclease I
MRLFLIAMIIIICHYNQLRAQLFPGLSGEELADALRNEFKPVHLLTESQVKDTLYAKVFIQNDTVKCIYSGLGHYLPSGVDPSQWVFGTGNEIESINLEHGWPQAKGAGEGTDGRMNMYHLFPSRVAINSDRGDYPYEEINDNSTQTWYYLGQELSTKPSNNIDAYSEFVPGFFEPRESVKGDIARAMFYFWTIYRSDALAADPGYFEQQREALCLWHEEDPVDDFESLRNDRIASYQGGKKNPFILDCTLVKRAYCPQNPDCLGVPVSEPGEHDFGIKFDAIDKRLQVTSDVFQQWGVYVVNIYGQHLFSEMIESNQWGSTVQLTTGIYVAYAVKGNDIVVTKLFVP